MIEWTWGAKISGPNKRKQAPDPENVASQFSFHVYLFTWIQNAC